MENNLNKYINESFENFLKEFYDDNFQSTVNPESKRDAAIYKTNFIVWYGVKGRSVIAPIGMFDETEGNIFKDGKVDNLIELIKNSDEPIELETSYCIPYKLTIGEMGEIFASNRRGEYEYEYIGKSLTTGDSELDDYISFYNDVDDTMEIFNYISDELLPIMDKYHLEIATGRKTIKELKIDLVGFVRDNGIDTSEAKEFYQYLITKEKELYEAINENQGDINSIRFQLRDGNHRYRAAKDIGLSYIMCDLHIPENSSVTLQDIEDRYEVR